MTVQELIDLLQSQPDKSVEFLLEMSEAQAAFGYDTVDHVRIEKVAPFQGGYTDDENGVIAVVISACEPPFVEGQQ